MAALDLASIENFGAIDADEDALLRECFRDHPAYTAAKAHDRFLVVGRKGSGKTAIFKRLITERDPSVFGFGHTFDDYPWHYHDLQAEAGVPEERRYVHSWRYLILMGLAKILLNVDQSQPWDEAAFEALGDLESFVVDSYGSRDPDLTQLFQPEKKLRFKGGLKLAVASIEGESVLVKELPLHVQEVNRSVQASVLTALNPDHDYYVCFDQLDLGFTITDPRYAQRLIGLILAASDIRKAAVDNGKRLSVVVFLRDDIYELLQFEDKNKITENNMVRVEWDKPGSDLTLKNLMERRFGEVAGRSDSIAWSEAFDESREMPGRQTKYAHICDRTFLRPRDMIKFCNEALAAYKQDDDQADADKFTNAAVIAARPAYSTYLLRELDDEIAKHVPSYKEYLEVLKRVGSVQFSPERFKEEWSERGSLRELEPQQALEDLFEFSVIGYLKSGGGGGGSKYVWRYLDPGARFDPAADTFRVHAGFKEALDLVYGTGGKEATA
ncbi:MAG TPA: hypothetical protein VIM33_09625 [Gaiellaceae bacterium]|jgi:hypothetical protein